MMSSDFYDHYSKDISGIQIWKIQAAKLFSSVLLIEYLLQFFGRVIPRGVL
jgi:hypothetical protein